MKDLTKGNIYKTFLLFAIPLIFSGFLSQAYSLVDTMIAGKVLNAEGLAATGATSAFQTFFSSFFWGYGNGFSIYLARLFGSKDYKKLKNAVYINYSIMFVVILLLSLAVVILKDPIFTLLDIDPQIRTDAGIYFTICMLGSAFILLNANGVYIMNAMGNSSFPLYMSILSTVINISGNLFSVLVLRMGVAGLAISTVISAIVTDIFYLLEIKRCFKKLGVNSHKVKFTLRPLKNGSIYSVPASLQQCLMYLSSLIISPMINGIGSTATAAYVICLKMYDINATVFQNSSKTVSTYIAQNIGAKQFGNIRRGLRVGFLQGAVFVLPILLLCVVFADKCCSLFISSQSSSETLNLAIVFVRYFMPFVLFNMVNNLFHSFYRGVAAMALLITSSLIGSVSRIVATYFLVRYYGMNGVYLGWVISWIVECVFSVFIYLTGLWKTKEIKVHLRAETSKGIS